MQVTEPRPSGGGATDETYYSCNVLDKLTQVSMTRNGTTQLRTFNYDSDFRLSSVTQPENGTVSYTYVDNDPINYSDPEGLQKWAVVYWRRMCIGPGGDQACYFASSSFYFDDGVDGGGSDGSGTAELGSGSGGSNPSQGGAAWMATKGLLIAPTSGVQAAVQDVLSLFAYSRHLFSGSIL